VSSPNDRVPLQKLNGIQVLFVRWNLQPGKSSFLMIYHIADLIHLVQRQVFIESLVCRCRTDDVAVLLKKFGIGVKFVPGDGTAQDFGALVDEHTKAFYTESIGNPKYHVADIPALAEVAHAHGVPLIVDNTFGMGGRPRVLSEYDSTLTILRRVPNSAYRTWSRYRRPFRDKMVAVVRTLLAWMRSQPSLGLVGTARPSAA
jgi:hypothetical protein